MDRAGRSLQALSRLLAEKFRRLAEAAAQHYFCFLGATGDWLFWLVSADDRPAGSSSPCCTPAASETSLRLCSLGSKNSDDAGRGACNQARKCGGHDGSAYKACWGTRFCTKCGRHGIRGVPTAPWLEDRYRIVLAHMLREKEAQVPRLQLSGQPERGHVLPRTRWSTRQRR